ncbi:MAG: ornithine carbamoyltransferase [Fidelibacterota bacterium]
MAFNFLHITDFTTEEILETFEIARKVKAKVKNGDEFLPFKGKTMAMIFAKPSARTRVSFETGMTQLGGHAIFLGPNDIGIGKREAVKDISRVVSRYDDFIMARLFSHDHMLELAEYSRVPVINGLTDYNHPCQIMADIFTILEHRGHLKDLKVVYIGDGNNITNSWINLAARLPMHLVISGPEGYEADEATLENAKKAGLSKIEYIRDPKEAVKDADVVYTDVWASMGQEDEAAERKKVFAPYQVNTELLSYAKKDVYAMHCLPAHRGDEITSEVVDGPHSIMFDEAENRMHIQKAIMLKLANVDVKE